MEINYLTGCTTCDDGLYNHITELQKSGECTSVSQAVRFVTEALNKAVGMPDYFSESQIRNRYLRGQKERNQTAAQTEQRHEAITESQSDSVESNGPQGFTASDSQEPAGTAQESETMPSFDVQARQEEVKRRKETEQDVPDTLDNILTESVGQNVDAPEPVIEDQPGEVNLKPESDRIVETSEVPDSESLSIEKLKNFYDSAVQYIPSLKKRVVYLEAQLEIANKEIEGLKGILTEIGYTEKPHDQEVTI